MKLYTLLKEVQEEAQIDATVEDLKDEFQDAFKEIGDALETAEEQKQEGLILTTASLVLALPAILTAVEVLGKKASILFKKVFTKTLSTKDEEFFNKLGHFADKLHHSYMKPLKYFIGRYIDDPKTVDRLSNILFHVIVAFLLIGSGTAAVKAIESKNLSMSTLESVLSAIKSKELKTFLVKAIKR